MRYGNSIRRFQDSLPSGYSFQRRQGSSCKQLVVLCGSLCTFGLVALFGLLILGHGIAKIVIGATHLHDCPAEPFLPVYLIVGAIVPAGFYLACRLKKQEAGGCIFTCENLGFCLGVLLSLFLLSWLISGTVFYLRAVDAVNSSPATCKEKAAPPTGSSSATSDDSSSSTTTTQTSLPVASSRGPNATTTPFPTHDSAGRTTEPRNTSAAGSMPGDATAHDVVTGSLVPAAENMRIDATADDESVTCNSCDETLLKFSFATLITEWVCAGLFIANILCTFSVAKCC